MSSLRDLQLALLGDDGKANRKDLTEFVNYCKALEWNEYYLEELVHGVRRLDIEYARNIDAFFVDISDKDVFNELDPKFKRESLGLFVGDRFKLTGRLNYVVRDVMGDVMGFCGWDKFEQPKYLDSNNYGYKAKETTLFGMEMMRQYYSSTEPVILVEGIVCCHYLRSQLFQSLASLGSNYSPYVIQILKRFGSKLVIITDADEAGYKLAKQAKFHLPEAGVYYSSVAKDIDDTRLAEDGKYEQELLDDLRNIADPFHELKVLRKIR